MLKFPARPTWFVVTALAGLGAVLLPACSDTESPVNQMGTSGSGGQSNAAGNPGTSGGGNNSSGTASGGMAGSGGGVSAGSNGGGAGGAAGSGGAAGAAGSGGSGGQPAYNPCPKNGDPCKIMPLGDSITDGGGSDGASYRSKLFHLALMNQQKISFVGSHQSGPDMVDNVPFPKDQEGHSGWTIDDSQGNANRPGLYPQMQSWLTNTPPHIVTLMIGTNDIDTGWQLDTAGMRLGLLVDRIVQYAPTALVVVAQMVPTTDDNENLLVQAYNATVPDMVKTRADAGKHVIMVDMYGAFTKNANYKAEYMNDKLHPKDPGLVVMAQVWYDAVGALFPKAQ